MSNPKNENESAINAEEELIIDAEVDVEASEEAASEAESPEAAEAPEEAVELADMSKAELFKDAENAREEAAKFRDAALRAEAEMQNVRRRASKDVEHAHKFGAEKLIQNLLPVIDSLEKALESSELVKDLDQDHSAKAVLDGVGLCHKMFLDTLGKENVAVVDPHGEPFDPNLHQAMSMVENPDMEPNSVVAVIQKGYQLNGRLVRPAMVMVSKGVSPSIDETV
ncbi:MAG: nucleotide exchange factor GrpE [Gammaproteobacteria bacterium]|jgi:molecular chaperone GrpE|nr:nucleotide exchange factor GrpE [Gammaproteobacteria bacterium]MBT3897666.1 nucleotide exchange factor GrpE [Gammaproteobacteria bacterium]MDB2449573.1 nucleotide exchange factor GrpE [Pseudomonadales bacterium]MDB3988624.1 nucleotide exchange factor GrpE [Pseudomonadales bacterium]|tara:strand:- start:2488 stop:3162 length:675 start_codon:yes stop_codon:yes gene_type:complete